MSDEPRVIAETENGRITSDGRIYGRACDGDEFEEVAFPSVEMAHELAALLADAVKRVREDMAIHSAVSDQVDNRLAAVSAALSRKTTGSLDYAAGLRAAETAIERLLEEAGKGRGGG